MLYALHSIDVHSLTSKSEVLTAQIRFMKIPMDTSLVDLAFIQC